MSAEIKRIIADQAIAEGFSKLGICRPDAIPEAPERLKKYVDDEKHGSMTWMAERMNWRANPQELWPEARSVIMLAELYTPSHDPSAIKNHPDRAAISVYAQHKDYHDIVKKRLKRLGRFMIDKFGGEIKVFVDTAPVMEKPLAAAAGLGWQGKHTNLLARDLGNWFFLGAIFTTLELPVDNVAKENCGNCTSCLDACPTNAFPAPFQLDARRCISYLTIEHKGPVALELRENLGNKIYGCDDCLAACPWNKFAVEASEIRYKARDDLAAPALSELTNLNDTSFRAMFSGSPVKRIGVNRFLRNVMYAIGNSKDPSLLASAQKHVNSADPVLAEAARWAAHRLARGV